MSIGVWQPQGVVIAPVISDHPGQPNVLYESGAQILSGTVFKCLFGTANGVCYAESSNGITWTRYSGNPVISGVGQGYPKLFKNGSTYYAYVSTSTGSGVTVWTSTDMIHWTEQNATALVKDQAWEGVAPNAPSQLAVAGKIGNTWYGYYTSFDSGIGNYAVGQATSTDLINWTKNPNNPVITSLAPSNFAFATINGLVYGWSQIVLPTIPVGTASCPSDIVRYSAPSPSGPFNLPLICAPSAYVSTLYRTRSEEGIGSVGGQVADPTIVSDGTNLWMFYTATPNGQGTAAGYQISAAKAPNTTFAQLVSGYEGVVSVPAPTTNVQAKQLAATGSDNFNRTNVNPIGGNWTQLFTGAAFTTAQIVGSLMESSIAGSNSDSYWNASNWQPNQWVSIKINALSDSSCYAGILLRATPGPFSSATTYRIYVRGPLGGTAAYSISKYVNGAFTAVVAETTRTFSAGDVFTAAVVGTQLSLYQNGNLFATVSDSSVISGQAGCFVSPSVAAGVAGAQISSWTGGIPGYAYSCPDCRVVPNGFHTVQGTTIFDVQNSLISPTDSRAAGAPVDSRAAGQAPQNSRTPGTFGPGQ